jgi:hypothetical protein
MVRGICIAAGGLLIAVAFVSATNVADTRAGLIAEIVTLLSALAGLGLLLYGLVPKRPRGVRPVESIPAPGPQSRVRSVNDLLIGATGLLLAAVLLTGLAISAGWQWSIAGAVMLLPMMIGSGYLCAAFIRAPEREWKVDLQRLTGHR